MALSYTNPGWVNDGSPAINAANLNNLSNAVVADEGVINSQATNIVNIEKSVAFYEPGSTTTRAYVKGDLVLDSNGVLRQVTTSIAAGSAVTSISTVATGGMGKVMNDRIKAIFSDTGAITDASYTRVVYGTTAPSNPTVGMLWITPMS